MVNNYFYLFDDHQTADNLHVISTTSASSANVIGKPSYVASSPKQTSKKTGYPWS